MSVYCRSCKIFIHYNSAQLKSHTNHKDKFTIICGNTGSQHKRIENRAHSGTGTGTGLCSRNSKLKFLCRSWVRRSCEKDRNFFFFFSKSEIIHKNSQSEAMSCTDKMEKGARATGYPVELFVKPFPEELICSICWNILNDPQQCKNGHSFCKLCIEDAITKREACPTCNVPLTVDKLSFSLLSRNLIQGLKVKCSSVHQVEDERCKWQGPLAQLNEHLLEECPLQMIQCPLFSEGCLNCSGTVLRKDLVNHLISNSKASTTMLAAASAQAGRLQIQIRELTSEKDGLEKEKQLIVLASQEAAELWRDKFTQLTEKAVCDTERFEQLLTNALQKNMSLSNELQKRVNQLGVSKEAADMKKVGETALSESVSDNDPLNTSVESTTDFDGSDSPQKAVRPKLSDVFENTTDHADPFSALFAGLLNQPVDSTTNSLAQEMLSRVVMPTKSSLLKRDHNQCREFFYPNGDMYLGNIADDKKHGYGTYTSTSGSYMGEWQNDMKHGKGTFCYKNGDKYEGHYKNNMKHGQGKLTAANGEVLWEGKYVNNKKQQK